MAVEGTLDLFRLPEILQLISQQQKTGILTVQGQNDIVAISFLSGRIVAADALNQTMEEGLTRVLVSEGLLAPPELARVNAEHQEAGGRLLDLLVERGYVPRPRLLEALRLQTSRLVEQLLRWEQGDFKFYSGDEVSYEEGLEPIPVEELLLQAGAEGFRDKQRAQPAQPAPAPALQAAARARPAAASVLPSIPTISLAGGPASAAVAGAAERRAERPAPASTPAAVARPSSLPAVDVPPAGGAFRKMKVEQAALPAADRRVARLLALAAAILVVLVLLGRPDRLVMPFPWQAGQRQELAQVQRAALHLKIDRAAKTFFLLEGHFPDDLTPLQAAGLLGTSDLRDPQGYPLSYRVQGESYTIQPLADGLPVAGVEAAEAITGNFLLDPGFITVTPDSQAPLVLLD
ncbi:MAG TPA: DUF4388 domain-containing protein [Thermoanaerobaculia bacterium]|nr:DUF4388 domain-containing protein [Thermoanaerobaculia bacterium]